MLVMDPPNQHFFVYPLSFLTFKNILDIPCVTMYIIHRQTRGVEMDQKETLRTSGTMLILSLINVKDRYGYEIIETLKEKSEDIFEMKEGTLYPLLHRLEKQGFLKSYMQNTESNRQRKYYSITKKGVVQLEEEKIAWKIYSKAIQNVLGYSL